MTIPTTILKKFITLWKEETGVEITVNQAISKLRLISRTLDADKRNHSSLKTDLIKDISQNSQ